MAREKTHYIDNKLFLKEIILYKKLVKAAEKQGLPKPGVSQYIGQCFLDIAENLAKKPNFTNYPFKEDMMGDGIENCIMYTTNFNPSKSKNPFSFFTQIIFYAFLRRIQKEKKQLYIKLKKFEQEDPTGRFKNWLKDKFEPTQNPFNDMLDITEEEKKNFDEKLNPKKKAAIVKPVAKKKKKKILKIEPILKIKKERLDNYIK